MRIFFRIGPKRKVMSGELVQMNQKTFWVQLPKGRIIKRKIKRDLPGTLSGVIAGMFKRVLSR